MDAVTAFVDHLETLQTGMGQCTDGLTDTDSDNDGFNDLYVQVPAGTCVGIVTRGAVVPHTSTVEEVDWFTQARDIHAGLQPCGRPPHFAAVTWDLGALRAMLDS